MLGMGDLGVVIAVILVIALVLAVVYLARRI